MMYQKKAPCTIGLVVINIAVFFFLAFQGMTEDAVFMVDHGAMYVPYIVELGEYYRMITSMFMHFDLNHLMNNMITLGALGWQLELEVGKIKYLLIYFLSGIAGNMLSMLQEIHANEYAVSVGASGAIFGIIGALLYIAIRNHGRIRNVSGKGILFMVVLTLYHGYTNMGVNNMAHIGGLIMGFAAGILLYRKRRKSTLSEA
ncbi:rhomboid family intramembrane serine protease [Sporofaciens sp. SGI.106]|uniref:rhomboid family intramembrane serine protease n=1 Tax=Sporofaciens sp. SGI.106 TaxID=3420568 RepID=UPI002A9977FB|nr:rhomboid family intramembrane serine protease [Lachnoclostridium sp.]